ncbi:MAG: DNRLRE domain-containing protein [bacterium]|nr:DNRLRE domain-containing protein [bacterium]
MRNILIAVFVLTVTAYADVDTLQPDPALGKDAFVYEGAPNQCYGDSDHLSVTSSTSNHMALSYIKFVRLDNYFGATIHQVTLELYVVQLNSIALYFECAAILDSWDEDTITWSNQPWQIFGTEIQVPYPTTTDVWWSVDVTDIVSDWANGIEDHHGFILYDGNSDGNMVRFASSDEPVSTIWPKLIIDYTGDVGIASVSLGNLKAVFQ